MPSHLFSWYRLGLEKYTDLNDDICRSRKAKLFYLLYLFLAKLLPSKKREIETEEEQEEEGRVREGERGQKREKERGERKRRDEERRDVL